MAAPAWSLGLLGYPLGHSLSPRLHAAALAAMGLPGEYRLYPVSPADGQQAALAELFARMRGGRIHGLNVTIPHKQAVQPFLDDCTPAARAIGAVNTIIASAGLLTGDNTDAPGFLADLRRVFPHLGTSHPQSTRALVLGAGGAARAVAYALAESGWRVIIAARRLQQAQSLCAALQGEKRLAWRLQAAPLAPQALSELPFSPALIVNATAAGMAPHSDHSPWPDGAPLPHGAAVYDLVYNPAETTLLRAAAAAGLPAAGGLGMLVEQAALALERWTGLPVPRRAMWEAVEQTG